MCNKLNNYKKKKLHKNLILHNFLFYFLNPFFNLSKKVSCLEVFLSSISLNFFNNSFCSFVSFVGVFTIIWTNSSPYWPLLKFFAPFPLIFKTCPCCVPSGMTNSTSPFTVGISTVPPKHASTKEMDRSI